jgi:hypothetical protein
LQELNVPFDARHEPAAGVARIVIHDHDFAGIGQRVDLPPENSTS